MTHARLNVTDGHHVDSLLAAYRCFFSFHQEAQQCQQSYISWMKTLMVSVLPVSSCESVLWWVAVVG